MRRSAPFVALTLVALLATMLPGAIASVAQATPASTPAAVLAAVDAEDPPAAREKPLLERIPAWQVTGAILLVAFIATIVLFVTVRLRGQGPA